MLLLRAGDDGTDVSRHRDTGRRRRGGAERAKTARVPGKKRSIALAAKTRAQWRRCPLEPTLQQPRRYPFAFPPCKCVKREQRALQMTLARATRTKARGCAARAGGGAEKKRRASSNRRRRCLIDRQTDRSPRLRTTPTLSGPKSRPAATATVSSRPRAKERGERGYTRTLANLCFRRN